MNNDAITSATHLNVIPAFPENVPSDTYGIDYGRITGKVAVVDANEALADVVDAYRLVVRLSRTASNSPAWRTACRDFHTAGRAYAEISGLTMPQVAAKVKIIADCFA